jgi:phage host-nuclease inhibitor protein Gam
MTSLPSPAPAPTPSIQTRQQLEVVLENIASLQRERDHLFCAQDNEIAAVRQRYRASLTEIENYLHLETSWAEAWAVAHPASLGADRSLTCARVTFGFSAEPPRIERASRRWTWTRIAATLAQLDWGKRYLRVPPPEVDKDAIVTDLAKLSLTELRNAGIRVVHGERFFITPHSSTETISEPAWQEAA